MEMDFHDDVPTGAHLEPFRTVKALADAYNAGADNPSVTDTAIRNQVSRAKANGLNPFIIRMGRKILISEPGYRWWIRSHAHREA
jgi:hypothetical protein